MDVFFPERVSELRKQRGLTCKEVGRRAGKHKDTISKIEAGELKPNEAMLQMLADALGISVKELSKDESELTNVETIRRIQQVLLEKLNIIVEITNKINSWIEGIDITDNIENSAGHCSDEIVRFLKGAERCTRLR
jgi:transcriptional regulator with XRE-family HTH domain